MILFDPTERRRYGIGRERFRLEALRHLQRHSFASADGLIFLNEYARRTVSEQLSAVPSYMRVISHGVAPRFSMPPRRQREMAECDADNPFRLLYVSTVDAYKHQWNVVEAIAALRQNGVPLWLDLVGGSEPHSLRRLQSTIQRCDPEGRAVRYHGLMPFERIHEMYRDADAFIFASSCENLPNILLEAMASGLPILCAARGPMPEVLGSGGVFFDPEYPASLQRELTSFLKNRRARLAMAKDAFERVKAYTWDRCTDETFGFLREVAARHRSGGAKSDVTTALDRQGCTS